MLARRIIPTLLTRGRELVKGIGFDSWRSVGVVTQAMRIYQKRAVDEMVLLDITATAEGRGPDLSLVSELAAQFCSPLTVGGGVRTVEQVVALLRHGADKVVIGTAAVRDQDLLRAASDKVGSQAIVAALDVKDGFVTVECGKAMTDWEPVATAKRFEVDGAGEILLTSVERDGRLCGYDLGLIRAISSVVNIPVVASGGCGVYRHMLEAIEAGADAVASAAMFQFTDQTPAGAARFLKSQGIEVRVCA